MFGFIKRIQEQKEMLKQFKEMINADMRKEAAYIAMNTEELSGLSDEELYAAAEARTVHKVEDCGEITDGIKTLSQAEKNFYVCQYYSMEVNNGGLCQFFVNSGRVVAPLLSECLKAVGAVKHQNLFDEFIMENKIDLNDLDSFVIDDAEEFETQAERYPFDEFDDQFSELPPLEDILAAYVRNHIQQF